MTPEHQPRKYPEWAEREREGDMAWIGDNVHVLWPAASEQFAEVGRGALLVNTTVTIERRHPFGYFPREVIETGDDEDLKRMVRDYDPEGEFVVQLLKTEGRVSTYRVRTQPHQPNEAGQPGPFSLS
jgi:hypothetical protein